MKRRRANSHVGVVLTAIAVLCIGVEPAFAGRPAGSAVDLTPGPGAGLTAAPAPDLDWPTWGYDVARTGHNPNETVLSPSTVGGLHLLWSFPFAGQSDNAPVFAAGVDVNGTATDLVYAGDRSGAFHAVDASTGQEVWSRDLGDPVTACGGVLGVTDTAVIDRSRNALYVAGPDGRLYALDLGSGADVAGWPLQVTEFDNEYVWGAINMVGDQLFVPIASRCDRFGTDYGRVARVDIATAVQTAAFYVTDGPNTGVSGGGVWGWGGASVDAADGDVFIATANGYPLDPYEHFLYAESVVRLTADLGVISSNYPGLNGKDVDFGTTPVLYDAAHGCGPQLIVENKDGEILSYDRDDLAAGPLSRVLVSKSGMIGVAGYDPSTRRIFVGNQTDSPDGSVRHGLLAFGVGTDCKLHLRWQRILATGGLSASPVSANGVLYFGDGGGHRLIAVDERTRKKLWSSGNTFSSSAQTEPVVINGHLYETTGSNLYAFGL